MAVDWQAWHRAYADPQSRLSQRLLVVQGHVAAALDRAAPGPLRVLSLCAGEGRDLLGVLPEHSRREDVVARLVESDPHVAGIARAQAAAHGLTAVEVVTGDAAELSAYAGLAPADLVLVCGVFGNISDAAVRHTVSQLPQLCGPAATVIWTRHRAAPDLTPSVRQWFQDSGFDQLAFDSAGAGGFGVGVQTYVGPPVAYRSETRLFTFLV